MNFERNHAHLLRKRLIEPVNNIVIVASPRQVGKTTMVQDVMKQFGGTLIALGCAPMYHLIMTIRFLSK